MGTSRSLHLTLSICGIMANAFRLAANTIAQRKDGVLKKIFFRIAIKKGLAAAITALARRLAEVFWIMTVNKVAYIPKDELQYESQRKKNAITNIRNKMKRMNINADELIFNSMASPSLLQR